MANGSGSTDIVNAMGKAGMLGFFGAAGLPTSEVARAIDELAGRAQVAPVAGLVADPAVRAGDREADGPLPQGESGDSR